MQYKGFIARYHFAVDAGVYVGEIINVPDVIAFSAQSIAHLREAMKSAIENYLDFYAIESNISSLNIVKVDDFSARRQVAEQ